MGTSPRSLYVLPRLPAAQRRPADAAVERLQALRAVSLLDPIDLHVVTRLGRLVDAWDPDALVACAAAVRAPRQGHICVDLQADDPWPGEAEHRDLWPTPAVAIHALEASPLVATPEALRGPAGRLPFVFDGRRLYTARLWDDQARLVERLRAMAAAPVAEPPDPEALRRGLAVLFAPRAKDETPPAVDRQQIAGAMATLRRLTVITGGPGMGKTHTVRNVLALLNAQHAARLRDDPTRGPLRVALAAPTGKAAARVRESLLKDLDGFVARAADAVPDAEGLRAFLLGLEARTLHRLLGVKRDDPTRFRHDAEHPLPYDVVIVDETSMVDFAMMARLVDAVRGATRLVLLGDRHQLASVEAGTVLADLCGPVDAAALQASPALRAALAAYDVPVGDAVVDRPTALPDAVVQLNRTYRFEGESSIGRFAMACLAPDFDAGRAAEPLFDPRSADAARFDPGDGRALPEAVLAAILDGYAATYAHLDAADRVAPEGEPAFHRHTLDRFDRFRVLCAHTRGALGVEGVNAAVRQALAGQGRSTTGTFWPGRPILVRRNDYDVGLYNGDIGLVVTRSDGEGNARTFVAFPGPDALPKDGPPPPDAQLVRYVLPARLPEHDTCFALTIHKSQGSEYDEVMVVLPARPSRIVTRELLYTGVTRAKKKVNLVAERAAFVKALGETVQRASGLRDALWSPDPLSPADGAR